MNLSGRHYPPRAVGAGVLALCLLLLLTTLVVVGCSQSSATPETSAAGMAGARTVAFTTSDGVTLNGHLFGSGASGVVLSHMYPADQTSWYGTARELSAQGYLVLTYDFRGYGDSGGEKQIQYLDRDVLAATQAIANAGATRVVLVGASMGGTASLVAAQSLLARPPLSATGEPPSLKPAGVATLSAPVSFKGLSAEAAVPTISCPLLFIAAQKDVGAAGAEELERLSANAGDLEIVPGSDHGTDLLKGSQASQVMDLLLGFLKKALP